MRKLYPFLLVIITSSCSQPSRQALIIGEWRVDSMNRYENGENTMFVSGDKENLFIQTKSNPGMAKFTDKNEAFFYSKNDKEKQFSSYKIVNDTIECSSAGTYRIDKINGTNLVMTIEQKPIYFDGKSEHPKTILTYYFTKVN